MEGTGQRTLGVLVRLADIEEERLVEDRLRGCGLDLYDVVPRLVQHVPETRHQPHLFLGARESPNATSAIVSPNRAEASSKPWGPLGPASPRPAPRGPLASAGWNSMRSSASVG